jgi:hypothetical protein
MLDDWDHIDQDVLIHISDQGYKYFDVVFVNDGSEVVHIAPLLYTGFQYTFSVFIIYIFYSDYGALFQSLSVLTLMSSLQMSCTWLSRFPCQSYPESTQSFLPKLAPLIILCSHADRCNLDSFSLFIRWAWLWKLWKVCWLMMEGLDHFFKQTNTLRFSWVIDAVWSCWCFWRSCGRLASGCKSVRFRFSINQESIFGAIDRFLKFFKL